MEIREANIIAWLVEQDVTVICTGGFAAIGALEDIAAILNGQAGTRIDNLARKLEIAA